MTVAPRRVLTTFVGAHVVNDFYVTVMPAFLPALADEFDLEYTELGILATAFTVLSGVLQATMGHLADQRGRRRGIVVFGFVMGAVGFVLMSGAPSFWVIVAVSTLCGLGGATYHPQATAYVVEAYPNDRGRMLGIHGWGGSVGHFLAPVVVVFAVDVIGWRTAMLLIAVPLLATAAITRARLHETEPNPDAKLLGAISRPLIVMAVGFGLLAIVLQSFVTFSVQMLVDEGWDSRPAGAILTVLLLVGVVSQPLGGRLFDVVGGRTVFFIAVAGTGSSVLLFWWTSGALSLVGVGGVAFFGFAMFTIGLALASKLAVQGQTGAAVGFTFGVSGLMAAIAKPVFGAIAESTGSIRSALPWTLVLVALAIPVGLQLDRREPATAKVSL